MNQNHQSRKSETSKPVRSHSEWVTFATATFILILIVGLVIYNWFTQKDQPPVLSVTRNGEIRQVKGQYYVPFAVTNVGGDTAESVQVIAELRQKGQTEETGEQQINFLSSGETEEGAFIFTSNPTDGELIIRVASYKLP